MTKPTNAHAPALRDLIQEVDGDLKTPEIRVWCHPHLTGGSGDDWYETFDTFADAEGFIANHLEAEETPLVALKGYEIDIYAVPGKAV